MLLDKNYYLKENTDDKDTSAKQAEAKLVVGVGVGVAVVVGALINVWEVMR